MLCSFRSAIHFSAWMFFIEFTYFALCEQQYQDIAPAVEVGIVTARGGGNSLDHCLLVIFV